MHFILQPWQLLVLLVAGWMHRDDRLIIDYLQTENDILKEIVGSQGIPVNDDQRRRLVVRAKAMGRNRAELA